MARNNRVKGNKALLFCFKKYEKSKNGFEIAKVAQPTNGLLRNFA
jgi:hypothetical protein